MNKDGTASYRGAIYFQTTPAQLSPLEKVAVLFEYQVDAEGNTRSTTGNGSSCSANFVSTKCGKLVHQARESTRAIASKFEFPQALQFLT